MTKTEVRKTTSGSIGGLGENTGVEKTEATSWSSRSVTVKVSNTSRGERVATINERLRGRASRGVNTAG